MKDFFDSAAGRVLFIFSSLMKEQVRAWIQRARGAATELTPLALLVPMVIILGLLLLKEEQIDQNAGNGQVALPETAQTPSLGTETAQPESAAPSAQQTASLTINTGADEQRFQVFVLREDTAAGVMMRAAGLGLLQLDAQDFGGELGLFINAINGLANDPAASRYWTLYVNGERSNLGASSVTVQPGDKIMWKFEHINE